MLHLQVVCILLTMTITMTMMATMMIMTMLHLQVVCILFHPHEQTLQHCHHCLGAETNIHHDDDDDDDDVDDDGNGEGDGDGDGDDNDDDQDDADDDDSTDLMMMMMIPHSVSFLTACLNVKKSGRSRELLEQHLKKQSKMKRFDDNQFSKIGCAKIKN